MSFPASNSKKYVQKVKILSLCLYSFIKMECFSLVLQQSKVQLVPPTKNINWIQNGFADSKIRYGHTSPHQTFSKEIFQKQPLSKKKSVMVINRPQWLVSDSCINKKLSGLHPKPRFQNSQCYLKTVAVICIYFTCMSLSSFQNYFRFPSIYFLIVAYPKYV